MVASSGISVVQYSLAPIIGFPLIGAILAFIIGRKHKAAAGFIATLASTLSFLWVVRCFGALPENGIFEDLLFNWMSVGDLVVDFKLRFDHLTAVMCLIVTGIGSLIHLYSTGYMAEDESVHRFFSYLNLFMFSMLVLVLGANLLVLFVGWEGVGLCSYLLIGFWFKDLANARAGRKAFVVNRIGDAGFLIGIFLLYQSFGTLDFNALASAISSSTGADLDSVFALASLALFIGATGKSAQIPLFVWLPDAMAGPTPVSALIHAATMVTAGVYMMCRAHFVFALAPETMMIVTMVALVTAFVAGTTALCQNDIKKVLAYSTVSQLGFMFMAAASGAYWVAIFHVMTHAFFKACLFLGAGSVIHGCHHEQDMRQMGGLRTMMPITFWTYLIATLAIAGIAPFSGYYSKHAILAALENSKYIEYSSLFVLLANLTAFITSFYMARSLAMTFFGEYRGHAHPHESPWTMTSVLTALACLSIGGGYLGGWLSRYLGTVLPHYPHHHSEHFMDALLHSWLGISGVVLALIVYTKAKNLPSFVYSKAMMLGELLTNKYYFDEIYQMLIVSPLEKISTFLWKGVDVNVIDAMVNGTGAVIEAEGEILRRSQTSQISHYALMIFVGSVFMVTFYLVF